LSEARREETRKINAETVLQMLARGESYKPRMSLERWIEKMGIVKPRKISTKYKEELLRIADETSRKIRALDKGKIK